MRCDSCFWMREIRIVYFLPICHPDPTPRYRVRFTLQARMISLLLTSGCFDGIDNSKEKVDPSLSLISCYRHFISARLSHRSHSLTPGIGNSVVPIPPLFWSSSSKLQLTYPHQILGLVLGQMTLQILQCLPDAMKCDKEKRTEVDSSQKRALGGSTNVFSRIAGQGTICDEAQTTLAHPLNSAYRPRDMQMQAASWRRQRHKRAGCRSQLASNTNSVRALEVLFTQKLVKGKKEMV